MNAALQSPLRSSQSRRYPRYSGSLPATQTLGWRRNPVHCDAVSIAGKGQGSHQVRLPSGLSIVTEFVLVASNISQPDVERQDERNAGHEQEAPKPNSFTSSVMDCTRQKEKNAEADLQDNVIFLAVRRNVIPCHESCQKDQ